jgi:hypothetical protein
LLLASSSLDALVIEEAMGESGLLDEAPEAASAPTAVFCALAFVAVGTVAAVPPAEVVLIDPDPDTVVEPLDPPLPAELPELPELDELDELDEPLGPPELKPPLEPPLEPPGGKDPSDPAAWV